MPRKRQKVEGTVYRAAAIVAGSIDEENRTVRLSFSSEEPYLRQSFFEAPWIEVLGHNDGEANFERLNGGATLHYNHRRTREDRLGAVLEAEIVNGRGEAVVQFSQNERVDDVWDDVKAGLLTNISVGYQILERLLTKAGEDGQPDEYRCKWFPFELSFVDVPADYKVGVGRSADEDIEIRSDAPGLPAPGHCYRVIDLDEKTEPTRGIEMKYEIKNGQIRFCGEDGVWTEWRDLTAEDKREFGSVDSSGDQESARAEGLQEGIKAELERQTAIRELFDSHSERLGSRAAELQSEALTDTAINVDKARGMILDNLAAGTEPAGGDARGSHGTQVTDLSRAGIEEAISVRAGLIAAPANLAQNQFRGNSLVEIAKQRLRSAGMSDAGMNLEVIGRAFTSSDFPLILENLASKAVLLGFEESMETWDQWCRTGSLSDFKMASRTGLSSFDDLDELDESGEYKYGKFNERGEYIQLATYGKIFALRRKAIINDDLNQLLDVPRKMGRAAARVPGDLAYGVLTSNPALQDGVALFHSSHANLQSASGITVDAISAMMTAAALQKDNNEAQNGSNIILDRMIVPQALKGKATLYATSPADPDQDNSQVPNIHKGTFQVIGEARLDAASSTAWYMAGNPAITDTVEVAFLDGNATPTIEQQQGWNVDGVEMKVRLDCAAAALAYQAMQKNPGV